MSKSSSGKAVFALFLVGALGAGSLAWYVKTTPSAQRVSGDLRVQEPVKNSPAPESGVRKASETSATESIWLVESSGDSVSLSASKVPVPAGTKPMVFAAESVVKALKLDNFRVLGVDLRDHTAIVGFNSAVGEDTMGSGLESKFYKALQTAFGQFPDVDKVMIEAGGKPMESGHVGVTDALDVIRPGDKPSTGSKPSEPQI